LNFVSVVCKLYCWVDVTSLILTSGLHRC